MSEYQVHKRKPKKKEEKANLVSEKISKELVPHELQPLVNGPTKHVALVQQVKPSSLWSWFEGAYGFFQSPLEANGFAPAGEHTVGLIIQPRPAHPGYTIIRALTNSSTLLNQWGHTALYVRLDGKIQRVIGFDPIKISRDVILHGNAVTNGLLATAGHYNNDAALFHNNSARTVEYALPRALVEKLLKSMPHHGKATKYPGKMQQYVGHPAKYLAAHQNRTNLEVGNCISWVMNTIIQELGANIFGIDKGERCDTAVVDLGEKGNAIQGYLTKQFVYLEKRSKKTLILRFDGHKEKSREPVFGKMPAKLAFVKGLQHLYVVSSVARFTTPWVTSMVPNPYYSMIPEPNYYLQSGPLAAMDTAGAFMQLFFTLADQYLTEEQIMYLRSVGFLVGTAVLLYGGGNLEIVYGAMSYVLPYVLEWLATRNNVPRLE